MGKKDNVFDKFLEKNFGGEAVRIERPLGGERSLNEEERATIGKGLLKSESAAAVKEEPSQAQGRGPGRPKNEGRGPVRNVNFLLEDSVRYDLELLKVKQHRSSLTELFNEAIVDLLKKYRVEGY